MFSSVREKIDLKALKTKARQINEEKIERKAVADMLNRTGTPYNLETLIQRIVKPDAASKVDAWMKTASEEDREAVFNLFKAVSGNSHVPPSTSSRHNFQRGTTSNEPLRTAEENSKYQLKEFDHLWTEGGNENEGEYDVGPDWRRTRRQQKKYKRPIGDGIPNGNGTSNSEGTGVVTSVSPRGQLSSIDFPQEDLPSSNLQSNANPRISDFQTQKKRRAPRNAPVQDRMSYNNPMIRDSNMPVHPSWKN